MPDDDVYIVTGANSGIGFASAVLLAKKKDTKVIIGCRSIERGEKAREDIVKETGNSNVDFLQLDLGDLSSVSKFADIINKRLLAVKALINNAGVMPMLPQKRGTTKDGFEKSFGINHIGHFVLSILLTESLSRGAPSRVITVTSMTHSLGTTIDINDLNLTKGYTHDKAYCQSKLCNVMFAYEYDRRFKHQGIRAYAICPGVVASNIIRDAHWVTRIAGRLVMKLIGRSAEEAAELFVNLATDKHLSIKDNDCAGYVEDGDFVMSHPLTYDQNMCKELWEASADMVLPILDGGFADVLSKGKNDLIPEEDSRTKCRYPGYWQCWWKIYHKVVVISVATIFVVVSMIITYFYWT